MKTNIEKKRKKPEKINEPSPFISSAKKKTNTESIKKNKISISKKNVESMLGDAIIGHDTEGMIVIDSNGMIESTNLGARLLLGYSDEDDLRGKKYNKILNLICNGVTQVPQGKDPVETSFETGKKMRYTLSDDCYCLKNNKEMMPVMLTARPVIKKGKVTDVMVNFSDISKEKRIDEIKSDFISIASHQLKTPLTVSSLHAEMLLSGHIGKLTDEQKECVDDIYFYNKKMVQILNVFLAVSKIELGTFVFRSRPTNIKEIIQDIIKELSVDIKKKNISISEDYDSKNLRAYTDSEFIRIAIQNILSNSVKYTNKNGKIDIKVSKKNTDIVIKVKDNGCGIPAKDKPLVFLKLHRGTNTKKKDSNGNGLGLYIAKSLINKCGGRIWFSTKENSGTTFFISLPSRKKRKTAKDSLAV